ncbi:hypothetical protein SAMN05216303_10865 [Rhodoferax sp. OV413]|uniref:hypothetical protein n=1 Tax=Rhodoferax sp. OV413 TaxID=1855285 RepID=UPI0008822926|nr:hypothetical protein [Rhodoferax sp. OV413]SDP86070.1 hypothetical protein SAMN05216303_10865 [Rhodoferax sp. OV413]
MDDSEKRLPVSFRLSNRHKRGLELGALHEHRSQTNFIEKLISDYCEQHGLDLTRAEVGNDEKANP